VLLQLQRLYRGLRVNKEAEEEDHFFRDWVPLLLKAEGEPPGVGSAAQKLPHSLAAPPFLRV
jgi:hypothetical protein